ncbi:MAG: S8 family serine peptidase [Halioglobus sp.]|nr:S8 family serine peptidase [Halioglobus sp.]
MRMLLFSPIFLLLQACWHPLEIVGEGDIVERLGGVRGCTLEEFKSQSVRCAQNDVANEAYIVSYEAVPRSGWVFDGWEGVGCPEYSVAPFCDYEVSQPYVDFTNETWPGVPMPALVAVFKRAGPDFSLGGSIAAPASTVVDSDTNDPNASFASNDSCSMAATISNPTAIGGYINEAGTGTSGRSLAAGDSDDYYKVELLAGQIITMAVADFQTGDADLYLHDSNCVVVDGSLNTDQTESLTVASAGVYFVNARVYSGATNYVLVIGNANIANATGGMRLSSEFVPGQAIMNYDRKMKTAQQLSTQSITAKAGVSVLAGAADREVLLELDLSTQPLSTMSNLRPAANADGLTFSSAQDREKWETLMAIKKLRKTESVAHAGPNYIRHALAIPNDEFYPRQWHYPLINLPAAWDLETGKSSVIVANIDTGMLLNHPDFQGQLIAGYDFIKDPATANDGDGIDANPDDPGDTEGGAPSSFHGTHVGGTIAARTNNNIGIAGVAWGVKIMPLRVLGKGGGTDYDIAQSVRYAAGLANDSGTLPARRADIMNLSLGGDGPCGDTTKNAFNAARNAGVIIVVAAGNETSGDQKNPAWCDGVVSVSAVGPQRKLTSYSNFGPKTDIAAPGGASDFDTDGDGFPDGVLSTLGDDSSAGAITFNYKYYDGTSMAAPHVAGVFALMKSANSNVTPDFIDQQLAAGNLTDEIGTPGRDDKFGYGLINAQKAVTAALNLGGVEPVPVPKLTVTPTSLNFGAAISGLEINAQNGSTGNLQVTTVGANKPWLMVTPLNVDNQSLGSYRVSVNRSGMADGLFSGQISVQSSVNTVNVPVIMTVSSSNDGGNAGYIYVLLINATTGETLEASPPVSAGTYAYTFENVPAGNYEIVAGTDSDNDFFICDPGEACGAYTTVDQPRMVNGNNAGTNLDFSVSYEISLPVTSANSGTAEQPNRGFSRRAATPMRSVAP